MKLFCTIHKRNHCKRFDMSTSEHELFDNLAKYYDCLYSFKNYEKEANDIMTLIRQAQPQGKTLLDVACGTAKHLHYFKNYFHCIGTDYSESMLALARTNEPSIEFFQSNMTDMKHPQTFDVITCLFSSIGYVKTDEALRQTWQTFYNHLNIGGVVVVEPWFSANNYRVGLPFSTHYEDDNLKITRMNVSKRRDDVAILDFHYLVAEKDKAVQYYSDSHEMRLVEPEQMLSFMQAAGFEVSFYQIAPFEERGIFVGVRR